MKLGKSYYHKVLDSTFIMIANRGDGSVPNEMSEKGI
jgi:hypothetical protein